MLYTNFDQALDEWLLGCRAMVYHMGDRTQPERWELFDAEDLDDPTGSTYDALEAGGLSLAEIDAEMAEWTD
jgi:hypothetical protein